MNWRPILAGLAAMAALTSCVGSTSTSGAPPAPAPPIAVAPPPAVATSSAPPRAAPTRPAPPGATTAPASLFGTTFAYQPLWPFRSLEEARTWQEAYRSGGHQPWHLDAEQTALSFTQGYLGFTEIDRVTSRKVSDKDALIGVGYVTEGGRTATAAVIYLLRFEGRSDGPWEVVGTDDAPELTLTTPEYGAKVGSPVTVGGRITGVDENIRVEVRQQSSAAPLGSFCCLPAGGSGQEWQATVSFQGATDPVLTIVARTGGHLKAVERFAITAVRS